MKRSSWDETAPGVFQGYSAALNVLLRVEDGRLGWHDPATGEHIPTFHSERARADAERARAETERAARIQQAARAETAEARAQELEAELRPAARGQVAFEFRRFNFPVIPAEAGIQQPFLGSGFRRSDELSPERLKRSATAQPVALQFRWFSFPAGYASD